MVKCCCCTAHKGLQSPLAVIEYHVLRHLELAVEIFVRWEHHRVKTESESQATSDRKRRRVGLRAVMLADASYRLIPRVSGKILTINLRRKVRDVKTLS